MEMEIEKTRKELPTIIVDMDDDMELPEPDPPSPPSPPPKKRRALNYWKGERPIYGKNPKTGKFGIVGMICGPQ